jgi:hypothetical protein
MCILFTFNFFYKDVKRKLPNKISLTWEEFDLFTVVDVAIWYSGENKKKIWILEIKNYFNM